MTYTSADTVKQISRSGIFINKFNSYQQHVTASAQISESLIKKHEHIFSNDWQVNKTDLNNFINDMNILIENLEKKFTRQEIVEGLKMIREKATESPFVLRAQNWPRGYQGDFETINYIFKNENMAPENSFGIKLILHHLVLLVYVDMVCNGFQFIDECQTGK